MPSFKKINLKRLSFTEKKVEKKKRASRKMATCINVSRQVFEMEEEEKREEGRGVRAQERKCVYMQYTRTTPGWSTASLARPYSHYAVARTVCLHTKKV